MNNHEGLPDDQCVYILVPGYKYQEMYANRKSAIKRCVVEALKVHHAKVIWCRSRESCLYLYLDIGECDMTAHDLIRQIKIESTERIRQLKAYKGYRFEGETFWCYHDLIDDGFMDKDSVERFSSNAIFVDFEKSHPRDMKIHRHQTIYEKRRAEFLKQMKNRG